VPTTIRVERSRPTSSIAIAFPNARLPPLQSSHGANVEVRCGACVTNAPSEYDGAELYER
jgi:hypothetical protein